MPFSHDLPRPDDLPYPFWEGADPPAKGWTPDIIRCVDWSNRICSQLTLIEDFPERRIDGVHALLHDPETHCIVGVAHIPHHPKSWMEWNGKRWGTQDGVSMKYPAVAGALITDIWQRKRKKRCEIKAAICDDRFDINHVEEWLVDQLLGDCREKLWDCIRVRMKADDPSCPIYESLGFEVIDERKDKLVYEWSPEYA